MQAWQLAGSCPCRRPATQRASVWWACQPGVACRLAASGLGGGWSRTHPAPWHQVSCTRQWRWASCWHRRLPLPLHQELVLQLLQTTLALVLACLDCRIAPAGLAACSRASCSCSRASCSCIRASCSSSRASCSLLQGVLKRDLIAGCCMTGWRPADSLGRLRREKGGAGAGAPDSWHWPIRPRTLNFFKSTHPMSLQVWQRSRPQPPADPMETSSPSVPLTQALVDSVLPGPWLQPVALLCPACICLAVHWHGWQSPKPRCGSAGPVQPLTLAHAPAATQHKRGVCLPADGTIYRCDAATGRPCCQPPNPTCPACAGAYKTPSLLYGCSGELWRKNSRLMDFSYAGYAAGEVCRCYLWPRPALPCTALADPQRPTCRERECCDH